MYDFETFEEELSSKEMFYSLLTDRKSTDKEYQHVPNFWKKSKMETVKDYQDLYLEWDVLLVTNAFEKFRNNSLKNNGL